MADSLFLRDRTPSTSETRGFAADLVGALAFDGGIVEEETLLAFLQRYFDTDAAARIRATLFEDLRFFRAHDPASTDYDELQILSIRRGMAAIAAHRIFAEVLRRFPDLLFEMELIAKYVQKDTNVEIHPTAVVGTPFGIDHGHGTVIGATARIGSRVFIYHGVTLGATGKKSRSRRRHPVVGDGVFFGNGSQVLGPSIVEHDVSIASGAIVADSYIHAGARIYLNVRIANVIVPPNARIYGMDLENPRRYWAQLQDDTAPRTVEFERFDVGACD
jgi:serine acetyltransferase